MYAKFLFSGDIDASISKDMKGCYPPFAVFFILLCIGGCGFLYYSNTSAIPTRFEVGAWFVSCIVVCIIEFFALHYLLPENKVLLAKNQDHLELIIRYEKKKDRIVQIKKVNYWWSFMKISGLYDTSSFSVGGDDVFVGNGASLDGRGYNERDLFILIENEKGEHLLLKERNSYWDGNPKWQYKLAKDKEERETIEIIGLEKLMNAIEENAPDVVHIC